MPRTPASPTPVPTRSCRSAAHSPCPGDPLPWGKPDPVYLWTLAEKFLYTAWGSRTLPGRSRAVLARAHQQVPSTSTWGRSRHRPSAPPAPAEPPIPPGHATARRTAAARGRGSRAAGCAHAVRGRRSRAAGRTCRADPAAGTPGSATATDLAARTATRRAASGVRSPLLRRPRLLFRATPKPRRPTTRGPTSSLPTKSHAPSRAARGT